MTAWRKRLEAWLRKAQTRRDRRDFTFEPLEARETPAGLYAVASAPGSAVTVDVFDSATGALKFTLTPYQNAQGEIFHGLVSVAVGDVNGDGTPDVVTAAGPTGGPHVEVFDGATGDLLRSFYAYAPNFNGGVSIAVGDVDGDGKADIVTGAMAGGGPQVEVFSGATGALLNSFYAYDAGFTGGVNVAVGDIDGDGKADIVTGAGPGGGPHVKAFSGATGQLLQSFYAYGADFTGGVNVAVGDIDGDHRPDIITGAGAGGGPQVEVFSGTTGSLLKSFFAGDPNSADGVNVSAVDVDADGKADVVTRTGGGSVQAFNGTTLGEISVSLTGLPAGTGYDTAAPTVALTSAAPNPTANSPIAFTATFNEAVNGFTASDVLASNGTVANLTQVDGRTYRFDVTPAAAGNLTVSVKAAAVTDAAGNLNGVSSAVVRNFQPSGPSAPTSFSNQTPPAGTVGGAYTYTFVANGSPTPTYTIASGTLPAGLTLSSAGVLSGTPTTAGSSTFVVTATNSQGSLNTSSITLTVAAVGSTTSTVTSGVDGKTLLQGNTTTVTFAAKDGAGNPVTGLTDVAFGLDSASTGTGTFGAVTDNGDGTYSSTFTGTGNGTIRFTATTGGVKTSGVVTAAITTVGVSNSSVTSDADGTTINPGDLVTVALSLKDANGIPISGVDVAFGLAGGSTGTGTFGSNVDNGAGLITTTFTATGIGTVTFTATVGGSTITGTQSVVIA